MNRLAGTQPCQFCDAVQALEQPLTLSCQRTIADLGICPTCLAALLAGAWTLSVSVGNESYSISGDGEDVPHGGR